MQLLVMGTKLKRSKMSQSAHSLDALPANFFELYFKGIKNKFSVPFYSSGEAVFKNAKNVEKPISALSHVNLRYTCRNDASLYQPTHLT